MNALQSKRRKAGTRSEALVDLMDNACRAAGHFLYEVPTRMNVIGTHGYKGVIAVYAKRATVDRLGWTKQGRPLAVEIKNLSDPAARFSLSRIEPHQRAALDGCADAGGLAVLLVTRAGASTAAIPWRVVRSAEGCGARSLAPGDMEAWATPLDYVSHLVTTKGGW